MEHHNKMDREQFYRELCTVLGREGFTTQPEQDDLLPVEWDGLPLMDSDSTRPGSSSVSGLPVCAYFQYSASVSQCRSINP